MSDTEHRQQQLPADEDQTQPKSLTTAMSFSPTIQSEQVQAEATPQVLREANQERDEVAQVLSVPEQVSDEPKEPVEGYDMFTYKAVLTIMGSWGILLIIGAQLAWGNQSTYIASYFHMLGKDVDMQDFYIVQPLIVLIATLFFPIGMSLATTYGSKPVLALGGISSLTMVFLASYLKSPTWFITIYSMSFGFGKGLLYSSALAAGWSHLPGRKGVVSGIIVSGFGFGGFFFGIITNKLCNPDNVHVELMETSPGSGKFENFFPDEVAERVPEMIRQLVFIWALLLAFGIVTITTFSSKKKEQEENFDPSANEPLLSTQQREEGEKKELSVEEQAEKDLPLTTVLNTYKFYFLYMLAVCHLFYGYFMSNSFKQFGFIGGLDDRTLTNIGSFGALFNGCFKVFWASSLDYFNFKPVYAIIITIQITLLVVIHWAVYHAWSYFIVICLSFMCDGSMTSMLPVVTLNIFGILRGPQIYSYMYSVFGVAAMLGTFFVGTCQGSLGYNGMLVLCLGFTITAAIISFFYEFSALSYTEVAVKQEDKFEKTSTSSKGSNESKMSSKEV